MTAIRAVGFDLDGTLFDHRRSASAGLDAFLRALDVEPTQPLRDAWFALEDEWFEKWRTGEVTHQEQRRGRLGAALPLMGRPVPESGRQLDDLMAVYLGEYRAAWRAFVDAREVLEALHASGLRIGILTNGAEEQQTAKLEAIGLAGLVDVVCTAEGLGLWKPDVRAFAELAARLGVAPAECLFVGDNAAHDIDGAIAAGMPALLVDHYAVGAEGLSPVVRHELVARRP